MRFVADVMLGRLARLMRFYGYDVEYDNRASDDQLLKKSRYRVLLTKDRALSSQSSRIYLVNAIGGENQLEEIRRRFPQPGKYVAAPVRCLLCNQKIRAIARRKVEHLVPPFIFRRYRRFYFCPGCRRIYWEGTHYEQMVRMIK